jgi:hypothetical protein
MYNLALTVRPIIPKAKEKSSFKIHMQFKIMVLCKTFSLERVHKRNKNVLPCAIEIHGTVHLNRLIMNLAHKNNEFRDRIYTKSEQQIKAQI